MRRSCSRNRTFTCNNTIPFCYWHRYSCTLTGNVTVAGDPNFTSKGFIWAEGTDSPTLSDNVVTVDGTGIGQYTKQIINLTPGAQYTYRAFVIQEGVYFEGADTTTSTNLVGYYQLQDCATGSTNFRSGDTIEDITLGTEDRVTADGNTYAVVGSTNDTNIPSVGTVTYTGEPGCPATERWYNYAECDGGGITGVAYWPSGTSLANGMAFYFDNQCWTIGAETTSSGVNDFDLTGFTIYNDCTECNNANTTTTTSTSTTTTVPVYYTNTIHNDGSGGWTTGLTACQSSGFPVTVYTAENATVLQIAQNGYIMYTDTLLTTPFNGNNEYFKSVSGVNDGIYMRINSSGITTEQASCPTSFYARFITCDDPTGAIIQVESNSPISQSIVLEDNNDCYEYYNEGGIGVDGDISTFVQYADCATCQAALTQTYYLLYNCETQQIVQRTDLPTDAAEYAGLSQGDQVTNSGGNTTYTIQGTTTDNTISATSIVITGEIGCPTLCNSRDIYVSTVSAEDAYCTQTVLRTVYHNGSTWADATVIYGASSDCSTVQAGNRWYSDGIQTWFWNGSTRTSIPNPPCP